MAYGGKYRPKSLKEICGHDSVVATLSHQIESGSLPNAYFFFGPAGGGKATVARLVTAALNCSTGPTVCPDINDPNVEKIMNKRPNDDLTILNAADKDILTKARAALKNMRNPLRTMPYRVCTVLNADQLGARATNLMLKPIEEPWVPATLIIICADNNLEIPDTLKSRCCNLEFRLPSAPEIAKHLRRIADAERITISEKGLQDIAVSANGSVNTALTRLEDLTKSFGANIKDSVVAGVVGELETPCWSAVRGFVNAVIKKSFIDGLASSSQAIGRGVGIQEYIITVMHYCNYVYVAAAFSDSLEEYMRARNHRQSEIEDVRATRSRLDEHVVDTAGVVLAWTGCCTQILQHAKYAISGDQFFAQILFVKMFESYRAALRGAPIPEAEPEPNADSVADTGDL